MDKLRRIQYNRISGVAKILIDKGIHTFKIKVNYYNACITIENQNYLTWSILEPVSNYFIAKDWSWKVIYENNSVHIITYQW
jgi:hypothetical protein